VETRETITRACGHEETVDVEVASRSELPRKRAWLARGLCRPCWIAGKVAERQLDAQRAARAAEADGLPALVGTAKQITWALSIRQTQLASLAELESSAQTARLAGKAIQPAQLDALAQLGKEWRAETSAHVWIDGRQADARETLRARWALRATVTP
jgi:hypothetical protein